MKLIISWMRYKRCAKLPIEICILHSRRIMRVNLLSPIDTSYCTWNKITERNHEILSSRYKAYENFIYTML